MIGKLILLNFLIGFAAGLPNGQKYPSGRIDDNHMHRASLDGKQIPIYNPDEETASFWYDKARATIKEQLAKKPNTGIAKNVIMFLGDGMSFPTLAAARVYLGHSRGQPGEEIKLSFEEFPHVGLSKTYCVDKQVADSACSATAYLCGVKANYQTAGVTATVKNRDCKSMKNPDNHVYSIARDFQLAGKRTGIVTTTRITHASPSGVYAHTAHREWESDTDVMKDGVDPTECHDIAHQLVHGETGRELNVIFGGGRWAFYPNDVVDEDGKLGDRSDGRNLVEEWKDTKKENSCEYVTKRDELLEVPTQTDYVMGLFDSDHVPFNLDRDAQKTPSLQEMTEEAIRLLSQDDKGYFLFVEGGRIDMAHHENRPQKALNETIEFHKAIEAAVKLTNSEDTLIVVTADHSHAFTVNGYPARGNDILGIAGIDSNKDSLPYTTLSYANGLGYRQEKDGKRHDVSNDDLHDKNYRFPAMVPLVDETHGGDDVGIFSLGPWAHLLDTMVEQNVIAHVMAFASCVGNNEVNACNIS